MTAPLAREREAMTLEEYFAAVEAHHLAYSREHGCWHRGPFHRAEEPIET